MAYMSFGPKVLIAEAFEALGSCLIVVLYIA